MGAKIGGIPFALKTNGIIFLFQKENVRGILVL